MTGKQKCKILKEIRREIAAQNDISLVIDDCRFQGDCRGTCPKCEAEVAYLEQELEKRRLSGKAVAVAGVAAAVMLSATGCTAEPTSAPTEPTACPTDAVELIGDVPYMPPTELEEMVIGEVPYFSETDGYAPLE